MEDECSFNDLDFLELLGDELGDEEENFTLSQIADRIELDYITSECMISDFADMTFELGYQTESEETGLSHSSMEVTTVQETFTLSENSSRFGNPVKEEDLDELISGTTPANTKKSTAWAVRVFNDWRISRNAALENIPNLDHFSVDDINRWLSMFIVEVRKRDGDFYPPKSLYLTEILSVCTLPTLILLVTKMENSTNAPFLEHSNFQSKILASINLKT